MVDAKCVLVLSACWLGCGFVSDKCCEVDSSLTKEEVYKQIQGHMNPVFGKPLPRAIFVLGGPGAGKGTQCANLVNDYGACWASHEQTGQSGVRDRLSHREATGARANRMFGEVFTG